MLFFAMLPGPPPTTLGLVVGIGLILSVPLALWLIWRAGRRPGRRKR